jgi:hypothetical protein
MIKTDLTYSHSASKLDYSKFNSNYKTVGMQTDNLFFKTVIIPLRRKMAV